jgi:hypothetical protein
MSNKLKLSSFLGGHSIKYINGVKQVQGNLDGEIKLLELSDVEDGSSKVTNILQEINKIDTNNKEFFAKMINIQYNIIKLFTDIDVDIDRDVFYQSVSNNDYMLLDFIKDVQAHFNRLKDDILTLSKNIETMKKILPKKTPLEQKNEALEAISKAYDNEKDTKQKKQYLLQIARLTEEIDKLEKDENNKSDIVEVFDRIDNNTIDKVIEIDK